jgi:hypothetical protein
MIHLTASALVWTSNSTGTSGGGFLHCAVATASIRNNNFGKLVAAVCEQKSN